MNPSRPWTTQDILEATHGDLICGRPENAFGTIVIDSRHVTAGDLFVPIKGTRHDGHKFLPQVLETGVRGILIDQEKVASFPIDRWRGQGLSCVAVIDTTRALGDMSRYHRQRLKMKVIALTGSNGKTTTRVMTAAVIEAGFQTLSTQGNFNNEIGLPLTLLRARPEHEWAVVELGMNHLGEIRRLTQICDPNLGIITNIAPAHLEGLGSIENVTRAKGELIEELRADGTAILNADDPHIKSLAEATSKKVVLYGQSPDAQIRATSIRQMEGMITFDLHLPQTTIPIRLQTPGGFMVSNALAAAAAGCLLNLEADQIKQGLEKFTPVKGRLNIVQREDGLHIIDDTYNANPSSMEAALKTLARLAGNSRRIAVLGDMNELGEQSVPLHQEIGACVAKNSVKQLFVCGRYAPALAEGARKAGLSNSAITTGTKEELVEALLETLHPDDWVLVKASRAVEMEQIVVKLSSLSGSE